MLDLKFILIASVVSFLLEIKRRKLNSPTRPWLTCCLDALCAIPYAFKVGPFGRSNDIRQASKEARKRLGNTDSAIVSAKNESDFFLRYETARKVGLERSKAKYTPFGYYIVQETLSKRVLTKYKMMDYLRKHPSIVSVPVKKPIFVIGFPRTGTTFLHELLGLHPDVKMHYTWEQMAPVPDTDDENAEALKSDRKKRYEGNKGFFEQSLRLAGDAIQRIHRVKYDEPEECTTPCSMELPWSMSEIPWIPFAAKEVIPLGAGETFATYKKFLQLMMWQSPEYWAANKDASKLPTWMLKCPFHMPYLQELVAAFPDATVVWTHRNPVECIASGCSLYETLMHMAVEESSVDRKALGKAVMDYTRLSLDKGEEAFRSLGASFKPIHIRYADNVKDSKNCVRRIVEQAGLEFSAEFEKRIDNYLAKSKADREALKKNTAIANKAHAKGTGKDKGGSEQLHDYSLEDYGLSEEVVKSTFQGYITQYNL